MGRIEMKVGERDPRLQFDESAHRYTVGGVVLPSITQILKLTGFIDDRWFTEYASQRGTATHLACRYLAEGCFDWKMDEAIVSRVVQFDKFLQTHKPELLAVEVPLHSEIYGFAGTEDFLFMLGGIPSIVEVKTGGHGLAAKLQTAAQLVLIEEAWGITAKRFVLELPEDGPFKLITQNDRMDRTMFLNGLAMVNRRVNEKEITL
jgi:hypothetical protein